MIWAADLVRTSEADMTVCGLILNAPTRCASASGRRAEAYPTSRRGSKSLSAPICSVSGVVASRRNVGTSRDASDAPTTADWCAGLREETTAILSGLASPTGTPAQSFALA